MRSVRSFFITLAGLTFVGIVALFTASIGILLAGTLCVIMIGQALASYFAPTPAPVRNKARKPEDARAMSRELRIWNDGKGTIIDM